ncbi:MAG TPA: DUF2240 family protein [Candidatus Thermoplasmatota archaeon]|nr:DUF2240 family protein [Candidatus Thermoplasmatota archaeon]
MGDVEAALAFVARRQASRGLPRSQWVHVMSLDLGWMSPASAHAFLDRAVAAGLLADADEGLLRLTVDPATVPVPSLFRPRPDAQPDALPGPAPPDGFVAWLDSYTRHTGCDRAEALRRVAQRQAELHGLLTADAALLWVAAEAGLDVRPAARRLIQGPPAPAAPL